METPKFKTEWTRHEFTVMEKAIVKHFRNKVVATRDGDIHFTTSYKKICEVFGLPYTSTSAYAMMSADCNTNGYYKGDERKHYDHFAMSVDGKPFAVVSDGDENYEYVPL